MITLAYARSIVKSSYIFTSFILFCGGIWHYHRGHVDVAAYFMAGAAYFRACAPQEK